MVGLGSRPCWHVLDGTLEILENFANMGKNSVFGQVFCRLEKLRIHVVLFLPFTLLLFGLSITVRFLYFPVLGTGTCLVRRVLVLDGGGRGVLLSKGREHTTNVSFIAKLPTTGKALSHF